MKEDLLEGFKTFCRRIVPLSDDQWVAADICIKLIRVPKEAVLVNQGEPTKHTYFVGHGLLESFYVSETGIEVACRFSRKHDFAAATEGLLTNGIAECGIRALEDSDLVTIDFPIWMQKVIPQSPAWEKLARRIFEMEFVHRARREHSFLTLSTRQRYEAFKRDFPSLVERIPQYKIAGYLGVTPVTLSRALGSRKKPK